MPVILAILLAVVSTACGPALVKDFGLQLPDRQVAIKADKARTARDLDRSGRSSVRYVLAEPFMIAEPGLDLALRLAFDAALRVDLYADPGDSQAILSRLFVNMGEPVMELRLALPAQQVIAAIGISLLDGAAATIHSLAVSQQYLGYRGAGFGQGDPTLLSAGVERSYPDAAAALPTEIRLDIPTGAGWSLLVSTADAGPAQVVGQQGAFELLSTRLMPVAIPGVVLGATKVTVTAPGGIREVLALDGGQAPLADLHAVLAGPAPQGDYVLYRWDLLPATLVFDFSDLAVQAAYLKRLAFFAEKPGFRGRLALDSEIANLHGWNAHDYPAWTLADFYSLAAQTGFGLNQRELALRAILLDYGIIKAAADSRFVAGTGAIISLSRQSSAALRRVFMDHEASHALFFQVPEYRYLAEQLWDAHDAATRRFWIQHLRWRGYDTHDRYLNVNELQAYLVQQSVARAQAYFRDNVLVRLAAAFPSTAAGLATDTPAILAAVRGDVQVLDAYLSESWGLAAGRFGRVRPLPAP
jgi:hypothetical protein